MNIPILRLGRESTSYDRVELDNGGGDILTAQVSILGLIRREPS